MKEPIFWKDHVVEFPNRYQETDLGNGLVQHVKSPGQVVQQGTPINARNLNDMDRGGIEGILTSLVVAQHVKQLGQTVKGLEGDRIAVTLTSSQNYPFNNSKRTVSLETDRNTKDYTVLVEVLSKTGGGIGDIIVSEKLLNGFKIEYTGAAKKVDVICVVQGGI